MEKEQVGRFFTDIPHVLAIYSYRIHGNMKHTEYREEEANRESFRDRFLGPDSRIVLARVNHSGEVTTLNSYEFPHFEVVFDTDALVAKGRENVYLAVTFADCPFVFLVDPVKSVYAVVHCGWRPIIKNILFNALREMLEMGAKMGNIRAAIGPGICSSCYEFGKRDAKRYFRFYADYVYPSKSPDKCHLDLREMIKHRLVKELKINPRYLEVSSDCTCCQKDVYFSFRGEKMDPQHIKAGIAIIGVKKSRTSPPKKFR